MALYIQLHYRLLPHGKFISWCSTASCKGSQAKSSQASPDISSHDHFYIGDAGPLSICLRCLFSTLHSAGQGQTGMTKPSLPCQWQHWQLLHFPEEHLATGPHLRAEGAVEGCLLLNSCHVSSPRWLHFSGGWSASPVYFGKLVGMILDDRYYYYI